LGNCAWSQPKKDIDLFLSKREEKNELYAALQVRHSVADQQGRLCGAHIYKTESRADCHADCWDKINEFWVMGDYLLMAEWL